MRREPAEQSKRVSRREATGRVLQVDFTIWFLNRPFLEAFSTPVKLFLVLASLLCCQKTVSKVAPRVKQTYRQFTKCCIAHLGQPGRSSYIKRLKGHQH